MMGTLYANEHDKRYANLSFDQLQKVDEYDYNLQNGIYEYPVTDKTRELQKENERLRAQLEVLENQNTLPVEQIVNHIQNNMAITGRASNTSFENETGAGMGKDELIDILRDHREEMENLVRNNVADKMASTVGAMKLGPKDSIIKSSQMFQSNIGGRRYPGKYYDAPKPI
jgi:hypothetical protein